MYSVLTSRCHPSGRIFNETLTDNYKLSSKNFVLITTSVLMWSSSIVSLEFMSRNLCPLGTVQNLHNFSELLINESVLSVLIASVATKQVILPNHQWVWSRKIAPHCESFSKLLEVLNWRFWLGILPFHY